MGTNEKRSIEAMLQAGTSGWQLRLNHNMELGSGELSGLDSHIYLIDTHKGKTYGASLKPERLQSLFEQCVQKSISHDQVGEALQAVMEELGDSVEAQKIEKMMVLAAATFNGTRTKELAVQQNSGYGGHWLVVLYRTKSGGVLDRPAYLSSELLQTGLPMNREMLEELAQQIVTSDIQGKGSVSQMIRAEGGALLHEKYKH